jgi:hypothetical protein
MDNMNIHPEFFKAMNHYRAMVKQYGEEHPITMQAFMLAFEYSPQQLKDEAFKMAEQHLPKPSGCLDNGQPVYNSKDLADHYDISFKEAETSLLNMMQQRKEHGLSSDDVLNFALATMIR